MGCPLGPGRSAPAAEDHPTLWHRGRPSTAAVGKELPLRRPRSAETIAIQQ
jgi:hypothetical protein